MAHSPNKVEVEDQEAINNVHFRTFVNFSAFMLIKKTRTAHYHIHMNGLIEHR